MTESTLIKAEEASVFVDQWEGENNDKGIWLSIQTRMGGAHCVINEENARAMIVALKAALGDTE